MEKCASYTKNEREASNANFDSVWFCDEDSFVDKLRVLEVVRLSKCDY